MDLSLIIPVYNRTDIIKDAIASIYDNDLEHVQFEVLVIDDGSDEEQAIELKRICSSYEFCQYYRFPNNQGPQAARNYGLDKAKGEYIKLFDSDDILCHGTLKSEYEMIKKTGTGVMISAWLRTSIADVGLKSAMLVKPRPYLGNPYDSLLSGFGGSTGAFIYSKDAIGGVRYDLRVRHPDDWFFLVKVLINNNPRVYVNEFPVFIWRDHLASRQSDTSLIEYAHSRFTILDYIHKAMIENNELTLSRKVALANYYYKDVYIAHRFDRAHYKRLLERIDSLVPGFSPSRSVESHIFMKLFGRICSYKLYIPLHNNIRRIVKK
jgi:glycosyltransferase involved in cell wall biosynthesis